MDAVTLGNKCVYPSGALPGMTYREWLLGMVTAQGAARSGNMKQAARIAMEYVEELLSVAAESESREEAGSGAKA